MKKINSFFVFLFSYRIFRIFLILLLFFSLFFITVTPTESMMPTITTKDFIMGIRIIPNLKSISFKKGEIVQFTAKKDGNKTELKRIVGIPGDTVSVKNGYLIVNNARQKEPYILEKPKYTVSKIKLEHGQYFLLGDNRNNSYDSSYYGYVNQEDISGIVFFVFHFPWQN